MALKSKAIGLVVTVVLGSLLPSSAGAQPATKVYRLGLLSPFSGDDSEMRQKQASEWFEEALRQRGWVKGKNIMVEYRYSTGRDELLPDLAVGLVRLNVDVLLTVGTPATWAAKQATSTIPIVMVTVLDPVAAGFVDSLARPGRNITGSSEFSEELSVKRMEILKMAIPKASRVAVLWDPTHPTNARDLKRTEAAARKLDVTILPVTAHDAGGIDKAFGQMRQGRVDALVVLVSPVFWVHHSRIVARAESNRLPTIWGYREAAEAGALMSYGPIIADQYRRAAVYVDKILRGASPADLPVEQPSRFELVINLRTAKALGIKVPPLVLAFADELIR